MFGPCILQDPLIQYVFTVGKLLNKYCLNQVIDQFGPNFVSVSYMRQSNIYVNLRNIQLIFLVLLYAYPHRQFGPNHQSPPTMAKTHMFSLFVQQHIAMVDVRGLCHSYDVQFRLVMSIAWHLHSYIVHYGLCIYLYLYCVLLCE